MTAIENVQTFLRKWEDLHPRQTHLYGFGRKGDSVDLTTADIRAALEEAWQLGAAYGVRHGHTAGGLKEMP